MKSLFFALWGGALCLLAQPSAVNASLSPDTPVLTVDGRQLTAGELRALIGALPEPARQNPKAHLQTIGLMLRLTEIAEQEKLDQTSPVKEQLMLQRVTVLSNAGATATHNKIAVSAGDVKQYYEANRDRYQQVRVKVLYVSYGSGGGQVLTEEQAKAKMEKLAALVRAGADFVKLVREHSEDAESKAKDGDYATIRKSDKLPDEVKTAVFALKAGQVSEPVRLANGFYLFRAEEVTAQALSEVTEDAVTQVRQERFRQRLQEIQAGVKVRIDNEDFFRPAGPAAASLSR
jgi:hypothetical protein